MKEVILTPLHVKNHVTVKLLNIIILIHDFSYNGLIDYIVNFVDKKITTLIAAKKNRRKQKQR